MGFTLSEVLFGFIWECFSTWLRGWWHCLFVATRKPRRLALLWRGEDDIYFVIRGSLHWLALTAAWYNSMTSRSGGCSNFSLLAVNPSRKDVHPNTMQDRNRSFLDIKSLFQSSKRPRSINTAKTYHYQKRESSSSRQSTIPDERSSYILQRSLVEPHLSTEATVFRKLSVRPPPCPPRTQRRSPNRPSGLCGVPQPGTMNSADSLAAQFSSLPRSASPQPPLRHGDVSPPGMTPPSYTPFSHVAQQTQGFAPNTRDTSNSGPTHSNLQTSHSSYRDWPSVELQRVPAPGQAPWIPESIEPSLSFHSQNGPKRSGPTRPATNHGYRDRMLVHAPVNRNWETQ
jgi:hypothetical protein